MRAAVITFNILSGVLGLLFLPLVPLFGGLGILCLAYNRPGETVLGLAIAAVPIVLPAVSMQHCRTTLRTIDLTSTHYE